MERHEAGAHTFDREDATSGAERRSDRFEPAGLGTLVRMATSGGLHFRVPFEGRTTAPAAVRTALSERLDPNDPIIDDVVLAASELVTNTVLHTDSDGEVRLWHDGERLRLEVRDADRRLPRMAEPGGPNGGFGLRIVAATSAAWGAETTAEGKVVWAEFFTGRDRARGNRQPVGTDRQGQRC